MSLSIYIHCYDMFRPHMDHHQAIFIVTGETTALYTLSSVLLGTSLFLLVSFVAYFHCFLFRQLFLCFYVVYFVVCAFCAVFPYIVLYFNTTSRSSQWSLSSCFLTNVLYAFLFYSMRPTCPAHLILLDLIILITIISPQLRNFVNCYDVLSKNSKNRIYIRN
jgi:hypothetical protein